MKKPSTITSNSGLRGEYDRAADDYTVAQDWHAYTPEMHARWRRLYARQSALVRTHACASFREGWHGWTAPRASRASPTPTACFRRRPAGGWWRCPASFPMRCSSTTSRTAASR
ncbi:hypothetical protein ACFSLT_10320 [Novosphingobium resinovorum]